MWPRERRGLWLMAAPFLAGTVLLVLGPALWSLAMAFTDWNLVRPPSFVGADNFRELAGDPDFRIALRNTLGFIAAAVPVRLIVTLVVGLILARPGRGDRAATVAVVAPAAVPEAAMALAWLWLLNPLYGPINLVLGGLGLPTPAWLTEPTTARWAIVLMATFAVGEGVVLVRAARAQLPRGVYEMAAEQGAGPASSFVRVTLPLLAPILVLLAVRDTAMSMHSTFVPALLVTQGGPPPSATTYLPLFVYREGFEYLRYGYASAASVCLLAVSASIVWLEYRLVRRWGARALQPMG